MKDSAKTGRRIAWIDAAKGILIIFVIIGHTRVPHSLRMYFSSFYMSMFFFLSGITFKPRSFCVFLRNKFRQLLVPYLGFSVLLIAFKFLKSLVTHNNFDVVEAVISIFLPMSGRTGGTVYELWFLPCLFIVSTILNLILAKESFLCVFSGSILMVACITYTFLIGSNTILTCVVMASVFLLLGYLSKGLVEKFIEKSGAKTAAVAMLCFVASLVVVYVNAYLLNNTIDFSASVYGDIVLFILGGIISIIFYVYFSNKVSDSTLLNFIGRNSLYFYAIHYMVLSAVSFVTERMALPFSFVFDAFITLFVTSVLIKVVLIIKESRGI